MGITSDKAREARIELARLRLMAAETQEERSAAWVEIKREVAARSPEQVLRMEEERGLHD